jgi:uncharacterized membrane protein YphA (DoxX/SURF4 family)
MKVRNILSWSCRVVAAVIMLQTLFFKFTASPESVYIFTKVGIEPWGRIGTGIAELVAAVLLLIPATVSIGAVVGIGLMLGAIATHVGIIGISVMDDGGLLFFYACMVLLSCSISLLLHKDQIIRYKQMVLR